LSNLFNAFITPGPIASPHDLSLGKNSLSITPTLSSGFNFLYETAALDPEGPPPIITTSKNSLFFFLIFPN